MRIFADENIDHQIMERLRLDGHIISSVAAIDPGIPDVFVLHLANEDVAILITEDKDFGELVFREQRSTSGVVLIRLDGLSPQSKAEVVASMIREHAQELSDAFSVITPGNIRIRRDLP